MKNTLLEMTDYGSEPILLEENKIEYIVIPVFEIPGYDEDGNYCPSLDVESMTDMFNSVMSNLKSKYENGKYDVLLKNNLYN